MTQATDTPLTFLPDVLEEHLEELEMMLPLRHGAVRERDAWHHHLVSTDDRLLGHLDGVVAVGDKGLPWIDHFLGSDEPTAVEAGTLACLALGTSAAHERITALWTGDDATKLPSVANAFLLVSTGPMLAHVAAQSDSGSTLRCVLSARVLYRHGTGTPTSESLLPYLTDSNAATRAQAWHLATESAVVFPPRLYATALRDDDAVVRDTALLCAAWTGVHGSLGIARQAATQPSTDAPLPLRLLATLGEASDMSAVTMLLHNESLGALRLELAGLYGAPAMVDEVVAAMAPDNPRRAIAAGLAFTRMTGVDVTSAERVTFAREGVDPADDFANEFQDEGLLPDIGKAQETWLRLRDSLSHARRICWGRVADHPFADGALGDADMETRWWQTVRSRFWQQSTRSIADLERFPAR